MQAPVRGHGEAPARAPHRRDAVLGRGTGLADAAWRAPTTEASVQPAQRRAVRVLLRQWLVVVDLPVDVIVVLEQ